MKNPCVRLIITVLTVILGLILALTGFLIPSNPLSSLPKVWVPMSNQDAFQQATGHGPLFVDFTGGPNGAVSPPIIYLVAVPLLICGLLMAGFAVLGWFAFSSKSKFMANLYIVLMVIIMIIQLVIGGVCVGRGNKHEFAFADDSIRDQITDVFDGRASDKDWTHGLYCMDYKDASPYPGAIAHDFINKLNQVDGMISCTLPSSSTTNCEQLSQQCQSNLIQYLTERQELTGIITIVFVMIQVLVTVYVGFSAHKMQKVSKTNFVEMQEAAYNI